MRKRRLTKHIIPRIFPLFRICTSKKYIYHAGIGKFEHMRLRHPSYLGDYKYNHKIKCYAFRFDASSINVDLMHNRIIHIRKTRYVYMR